MDATAAASASISAASSVEESGAVDSTCSGRSRVNARSTMPSNEVITGMFIPSRARLVMSPKNEPVTMIASAPVASLYFTSLSTRSPSSASSADPRLRSR